jgi:hypothetical protein
LPSDQKMTSLRTSMTSPRSHSGIEICATNTPVSAYYNAEVRK